MTFDYQGIFGYDISSYQDSPDIPGTVDFVKMKATGASFVVFRASIGNVEDADYRTYRNNSRGLLPHAVYHYLIATMGAQLQAQRLWNTIKDEPPKMVWVDCEEGNSSTWRVVYDFIEEFKRLSGFTDERIGIYTGYYIWIQITASATALQKQYFDRFFLWLAWYFSDPPRPIYSLVRKPPPWLEMDMIQSGTPALGLQSGVESQDIDYDQLNGGASKLALLFGGVVEPPPTEEPMAYGTAKENSGRTPTVRSSPGVVSGNDVRRLPAWSTIEWVELVPGTNNPASDKWFKLPDGNYVQYFYSGTTYFTILTQPTTPEPPPPPPTTEYPATIENTAVLKAADGTVLGTYTGTLNKQ